MNCMNCKYADWERTAAGRLHPNGDGKCTAPINLPQLPKAFYWYGSLPLGGGGFISRKMIEKFEGCQRWQREGRK